MKIPVEWLKQYIKTPKSTGEIADDFTSLGLMLDKPVSIYEDGKYKTEILDLEHRMDRSDWLSILGCARDLAAYEGMELINPEIYLLPGKPISAKDKVKIEVKCPDLVRRFNTRIFKNIKVKTSPDWLKNRLQAYGIPSINNIVDITNYVAVELGQPMHAQDISKMTAREIVIRRAKKGEAMQTLLGEIIDLDEDSFVLTQNDKPTVLGGIVGGATTGIDDNTTEILLDAGNYNQINIRKTSRRLKIQNESVLRSDKFLHPDLTEAAIRRATNLILELAGGDYYENQDWYPKKVAPKKMMLRFARIKALSGLEIPSKFVKETLTRLGYQLINETKEGLTLEVPFYRTDVEVEDDIVSDVLRIYGYSKIPTQMIETAPPRELTPSIYKFEDTLRDICVNLGLYEQITDPLVMAGENKTQIILENSQSKLKNSLRTEMYSGLKTVVATYEKHKINPIGLFEVGKTYSKSGNATKWEDYNETRHTQVFFRDQNLSLTDNSLKVRELLDTLLKNIGINNYILEKDENKVVIRLTENPTEIIGDLSFDSIALNNVKLEMATKIPSRIEIEFRDRQYYDISAFVPTELELGKVVQYIKSQGENVIQVDCSIQNFEVSNDGLKAVLFRITTKDKANDVIQNVKKGLEEHFSAQIR